MATPEMVGDLTPLTGSIRSDEEIGSVDSEKKRSENEKEGQRYRILRNWNASGHQSSLSIYINLINTTVGAGCLTLPYTLSLIGFLPGVGLNLLIALFSAYTLTLLIDAAYETRCYSFKTLGTKLFGYRIVGHLFQATVFCQNFGIMCGYVVIVGEFLAQQMKDWIAKEHIDFHWYEVVLTSEYTWMVFAVAFVMFPVSLFRNMKLLSYTSALSLLCIFYMIVAVSIQLFWQPLATPVQIGGDPVGWLVSAPLMFFAYGSHNCVLPIIDDVKDRLGVLRVKYIAVMVVMTVFTAYATLCLTSHFQFGTKTDENVLTAYDPDNILIFIAKCAISFVIMVSFPIFCFANRHSIESSIFSSFSFSWLRWIAITIGLCLSCLILAVCVPFISVIFSFIGAVFSVLINFIYPLMIKIKLDKRWYIRAIHIVLLAFSFLIGICCLGGVTIDTVMKEIRRRS